MPFAEDLTPFFADFGEDGTLAGAPARVIFDGPAAGIDGIDATAPSVQIATASVPAAYQGATLALSRGNFTVREHLPDGTGLSVLTLSVAA